jgi:predicted nucleic acid-binding protein
MSAIVDSSAVIVFDGIGRLELLRATLGEIILPEHVAREAGPAARALGVPISFLPEHARPCFDRLMQAALGCGESEAIAWATIEPDARVILDERRARRFARELGLIPMGSATVLVLAKRAGLIRLVRPILDEMIEFGFRLSQPIVAEVLREAGE